MPRLRQIDDGGLVGLGPGPGDPYRKEVPFEFAVRRGQQRVYGSPCDSDGDADYNVRVRVWLADDFPFEGSVQPSMWFDRLHSRTQYFKDMMRNLLLIFEEHTEEWPEGSTFHDYLENQEEFAFEHVLGQHVLCLESRSEQHPNGLCAFLPPAAAARGAGACPVGEGIAMLVTIDVDFFELPSYRSLMLRSHFFDHSSSLLECVELLVSAHHYGHMQCPVRLGTPLRATWMRSELNEALYTPECTGEQVFRPHYGGPPTPYVKEDYALIAQEMFPGPAAVSSSIEELIQMHVDRDAWSDEAMADLRAAHEAGRRAASVYAEDMDTEDDFPSLETFGSDVHHARCRNEDRGPEDPMLRRNRTIEFAVSEGGDVWNFVHQFLARAIAIMPVLGVVPYVYLYKGLALYMVSLRLYTADAMQTYAQLVEPLQLGHVLINGPVRNYMETCPKAARSMLAQHGFRVAPGEHFHQQLLTHWQQRPLEASFPTRTTQRFPRAYQPATREHVLVADITTGRSLPQLRWCWPSYTTDKICRREDHADTSYESWLLAWRVGCPKKQFDRTDDSPPSPLSLIHI